MAVELPEGLKERIAKVCGDLEATGAGLKVVGPENLHLTIKFLGDITEEQLGKAKSVMAGLAGSGAFKLKLEGLGYFGTPGFIRIVWIGSSEGSQKLISLMLFAKLKLADVRKDDFQENKVHLTIARANSAKNREKLLEFLEKNSGLEIGEMEVKEVRLMESKLTPQGPIYKEVYKVSL